MKQVWLVVSPYYGHTMGIFTSKALAEEWAGRENSLHSRTTWKWYVKRKPLNPTKRWKSKF